VVHFSQKLSGKSIEYGVRFLNQTLFKKCEDCEPRITRIAQRELRPQPKRKCQEKKNPRARLRLDKRGLAKCHSKKEKKDVSPVGGLRAEEPGLQERMI